MRFRFVRVYLFILFATGYVPAWGFDFCLTYKNTACEDAPLLLKPIVSTCQYFKSKLKCDELRVELDIPKDKMKTCSPYEACNVFTTREDLQACSDAFEDTIDDYKKIGEAFAKTHDNFAQCDKDLNCKRKLIEGHPTYEKMSDEELNRYTATYLYREGNDYRNAAQATKSHRNFTFRSSDHLAKNEPLQDLSNKPDSQSIEEIYKSTYNFFEKNMTHFACLAPKAQKQLVCYTALSLIDPLLALKVLRKTPWLFKLVKSKVTPLTAVAQERRVLHVSDEVTTGIHQLNRSPFIDRFEMFEPTTETENLAWIKKANGPKTKTRTFIDIENALMKFLNDNLKDKALVTSLTNFHKKIVFEEIEKLSAKYPQLKLSPYSDFKSIRLAIDGNMDANTIKAFEDALTTANKRFYESPTVRGLVRESDLAGENWFRMGVGSTADEATTAARFSRTQNQVQLENFADPKVRAHYETALNDIKKLHAEVLSDFASTDLIVDSSLRKGSKAVSQTALDLVRKLDKPENLKAALIEQFKLEKLSDDAVKKLIAYARRSDEFSPGVYIPKREFVHYNDAIHGGVSIDFVGMGSRNLDATAQALDVARNLDEALILVRQNEIAVTNALKEERAQVRGQMEQIYGESGQSKIRTTCSGDDCSGVPLETPMSDADRIRYVQNRAAMAAAKGNPSQYRVAFFQPGIASAEARGQIVAHGESLEKILRKKLSLIMDRRRLDGITFGVDMLGTDVGRGQVRLIVGRSPTLNLSQIERTNIDLQFRRALSELNEELSLAIPDANYRASGLVHPN